MFKPLGVELDICLKIRTFDLIQSAIK
jgi:hypothetical protein